MKLLYCPRCQDARKLRYKKTFCKCRKSWGYYKEDGRHAVYNSVAIPVAMGWSSFTEAIKNRNDPKLKKHEFKAWTIGDFSEFIEIELDPPK